MLECFATKRAPFAVPTLIEKHVEKNRFALKVKKKKDYEKLELQLEIGTTKYTI